MSEVSIRDLRNRGGDVMDRVARGERLTVTRAGKAVAELNPLRREPLSVESLRERWSRLPPVDLSSLRRDVDDVLDSRL